MAHLLGSEYCLKSLSSDARDLHGILQELIAKAGPVPVMSWKFPDKKACDLDVPYLLQQYAFCIDEPEANQVSHIVLLELIIDRYNLMLQVLSQFIMTHLPAEGSGQQSTQTHAGSSLGLVAKKFWNRMGQMALLVRQLTDDARLNELRQQQRDQLNSTSSSSVSAAAATAAATAAAAKFVSNHKDQLPNVKHSSTNSVKSCQTIETAFVPCDSCAEVQNGFSRVSAHLASLCDRERLPSSLKIYRSQQLAAAGNLDSDWLAAGDLVRWSVELEKDANRLAKHFSQVAETNTQLKRQNAELSSALDQAKSQISDFDRERTADALKAANSRRELETKLSKLVKEQEAAVQQLKAANKALEASKQQLTDDIESARRNIAQQERLIALLDRVKDKLTQVSNRADLGVEDLEQAVCSIGRQLTDLTDQLTRAKEETEAANTRCSNLARQNETLRAKHRVTANRAAELSAENEQLKEQLDELEEYKDNHRDSGKDVDKQLVASRMQAQEAELLVKSLTEAQDMLTLSVQRLRAQVSDLQTALQKSEDEKRVLIEYPDLNGPINQDLEGTGDPLLDMQQQVSANETRIRLLREQTDNMRRALDRVGRGVGDLAPSSEAPEPEESAIHLPPISSHLQIAGRPPPGPTAAMSTRQQAWQNQQQQQQQQQQPVPSDEENKSDSDSSSTQQQQPFGSRQSARRISDPVPLWQLQQQQQQQQSRPPKPTDSSKRSGSAGRPSSAASGSGVGSVNSSAAALQAYRRSKAAGQQASASSSTGPTALAWSASPRKEIVYPCAKCNKPFKLKSDLAMHRNYCSGKT